MSSEWMKTEDYRYYHCELHPTRWKCKELGFYDQFDYKPAKLSPGVIATKLIMISALNPKIFDGIALKYKLTMPVSLD